MAGLAGRHLRIKKKVVVGEDADAGSGGSGNREVKWRHGEGHRRRLFRGARRSGTGLRLRGQGNSGRFFCGPMCGIEMANVTSGEKKSEHQKKRDKNGRGRKPLWRRRKALLWFGRSRRRVLRAGRVILAEERFFIEAQIACNGAHEAVAEDAAGQLRPIFIFQSLDKTSTDARGVGQFFHGNFAQFALALQAFTKISPSHEPEPVLDDPSATAKRSISSATARRLTRRALTKKTTCDP